MVSLSLTVTACSDGKTKKTTAHRTDTNTQSSNESQRETPPPPSAPEKTVLKATIKNGGPNGGPKLWKVPQGERVVIEIRSDVEEEAHLHEPYDKSTPLRPGTLGRIEFTASITGVVELELEASGVLIGTLTVR